MQNSIHVTAHGDSWQVKRAGGQRASAICRLEFYGTKDLVQYLSKSGLPQWTHSINV